MLIMKQNEPERYVHLGMLNLKKYHFHNMKKPCECKSANEILSVCASVNIFTFTRKSARKIVF